MVWTPVSHIAAAAKSLQLCPTLCNPIDGSPPDPAIPGILQARTLEWVAISSSNAWKWKVKVKSLSRVRILATPWTAAYQAPPSMGFSRQEYWSGVPLPSPLPHCRQIFIMWAAREVHKIGINKVYLKMKFHMFPKSNDCLKQNDSHVLWNPSIDNKSIMCAQSLSCVWLFATPWTVARQTLLPMGFPRQKYWSSMPFPFPGDLPKSGIEAMSPALQGILSHWATWEAEIKVLCVVKLAWKMEGRISDTLLEDLCITCKVVWYY